VSQSKIMSVLSISDFNLTDAAVMNFCTWYLGCFRGSELQDHKLQDIIDQGSVVKHSVNDN
jgi:hypothetical protein